MSIQIEWDTAGTEVGIYHEGDHLSGYEEPVTSDFGLLIGGRSGGAFMVEGSREDLIQFLDRAREAVLAATKRETYMADASETLIWKGANVYIDFGDDAGAEEEVSGEITHLDEDAREVIIAGRVFDLDLIDAAERIDVEVED